MCSSTKLQVSLDPHNRLESESKRDQGQYEKFGIENKNMFRIGSVECTEWKTICDKEGITTYPSYKVYPPLPIPPSIIEMEGKEVDTDRLKKTAYKYIGNRVIDISS